jgi:NDP-sugar pyrophosphorylase family protein
VEAGVLAFRHEVVSMIAPQGAISLEKEIFPRLIAARRLIAQITTQRFYDIGTPDRLTAIEEFLAG